MRIYFEFPNIIECLEIELLDNPAVKSWRDHFYPRLRTISFIQDQNTQWAWDENKLKTNLEIIKDNLEKLSQMGYIYHGTVPSVTGDLTRHFTNTLHRFFTHTQKQINFDSSKPFEELRLVTSLLQSINFYIHDTERYLPSARDYFDPIRDICACVNLNNFDELPWWKMKEEYRLYHSNEHYDVIFGTEILGKSILRSYLDGDNPNDWDTSGHYENAGCLLISLDHTRQDIYHSDDFKKWLSDHGMSPKNTYYDFPIGNVRNKDLLPRIIDRLIEKGEPVPTTYLWE